MGVKLRLAVAACAVLLIGCGPVAVPASPSPSVDAIDRAAVDWILGMMAEHRVVAIGETHRSRREHDFLRELIADPRLPDVVDDIAVEFGTSSQQAVMDRYIDGDDVPATDLRRAWTETTQQSGVWNAPMYAEFFEAVRVANVGLEGDRRIRVLLGDPDLEVARGCPPPEDDCFDRDAHFADVVQRESLDRGRRVLIVAGLFHVLRGSSPHAASVVDLLERDAGASTYVILPLEGVIIRQPEVAHFVEPLDPPHAGSLEDTPIGDLSAGVLRGDTTVTCDNPPCGTPESTGTLDTVADAYLYLGP
jgi:hypothetical protein